MDKKPIFEVTENEVGQRLDNYLLKQRKQIEKSNWYKLIRKGLVRINGKRVKPLYKLCIGDLIRIPPSIYFVESVKLKVDSKQQTDLLQHVIFEDDDYLVLNKPAGLAAHTGTGHKIGVIEIMTSVAGYENIQLAHRLDKDTSGCLLLAKNRLALLSFQSALKSHEVKKSYSAVLAGQLLQPTVVEQPLDTQNRVNGIRHVIVSDSGQLAQTEFTPIRHAKQVTLCQCDISSGRTHQIRVHAQFIGCPVLGDRFYGKAVADLPRQLYLHAHVLQFGTHRFTASMPAEFKLESINIR